MRQWAILTIALYLLCVSLFAVPVLLFYPGDEGDLLAVFYVWLVPLLLVVQAALLLVPVAVARQRPVKRRRIAVSVIIGAIPMAILVVCLLGSAVLLCFGEDDSWDYVFGWPVAWLFAFSWLAWGIVFWRSYASRGSDVLTAAVTRWLLRGSILEVLVAVPSHIVARHRDECCAPGLTLLGIVTGLSIAVMSFGPGVFFLFAERVREKKRAGP